MFLVWVISTNVRFHGAGKHQESSIKHRVARAARKMEEEGEKIKKAEKQSGVHGFVEVFQVLRKKGGSTTRWMDDGMFLGHKKSETVPRLRQHCVVGHS